MSFITSCAGETCERRAECIRHTSTDHHEVSRLCYSGFTFLKQDLPLQVFTEDDDD